MLYDILSTVVVKIKNPTKIFKPPTELKFPKKSILSKAPAVPQADEMDA